MYQKFSLRRPLDNSMSLGEKIMLDTSKVRFTRKRGRGACVVAGPVVTKNAWTDGTKEESER